MRKEKATRIRRSKRALIQLNGKSTLPELKTLSRKGKKKRNLSTQSSLMRSSWRRKNKKKIVKRTSKVKKTQMRMLTKILTIWKILKVVLMTWSNLTKWSSKQIRSLTSS